jgi:hypothetical protein
MILEKRKYVKLATSEDHPYYNEFHLYDKLNEKIWLLEQNYNHRWDGLPPPVELQKLYTERRTAYKIVSDIMEVWKKEYEDK